MGRSKVMYKIGSTILRINNPIKDFASTAFCIFFGNNPISANNNDKHLIIMYPTVLST